MQDSQERERALVAFLKSIAKDCKQLFIVGDLFDYWFEYKHVVPRGHTRVLGQLALMVDAGLKLDIFVGNHDLWLGSYLEEELGATVHHRPLKWSPNDGQTWFYLAPWRRFRPWRPQIQSNKETFYQPHRHLGI